MYFVMSIAHILRNRPMADFSECAVKGYQLWKLKEEILSKLLRQA